MPDSSSIDPGTLSYDAGSFDSSTPTGGPIVGYDSSGNPIYAPSSSGSGGGGGGGNGKFNTGSLGSLSGGWLGLLMAGIGKGAGYASSGQYAGFSPWVTKSGTDWTPADASSTPWQAVAQKLVDPLGIFWQAQPWQNQPPPGAGSNAQENMLQQIQDYINTLKQPLDPNDPMVKATLNNVQGRVLAHAAGSGVGGGLVGAAMANDSAAAMSQMEMQRQAMLGQALGLGANVEQGYYQNAQNYYYNQLAQKQAQGGAMGGLAGAALGYYMGGMPGMQSGFNIGRGVGGAFSTAGSTAPPPPGYGNGTGSGYGYGGSPPPGYYPPPSSSPPGYAAGMG